MSNGTVYYFDNNATTRAPGSVSGPGACGESASGESAKAATRTYNDDEDDKAVEAEWRWKDKCISCADAAANAAAPLKTAPVWMLVEECMKC